MRLALHDVPTDVGDRIRGRLWAVLARSPWRSKSRWPRAIIVQTPERFEVMHRAAFAAELRAAGLTGAAHEATARRVGPGEILLYLVEDNEKRAGVEFLVVALIGR
jgi:hypothetical protein